MREWWWWDAFATVPQGRKIVFTTIRKERNVVI